jgi:hypothetical protein
MESKRKWRSFASIPRDEWVDVAAVSEGSDSHVIIKDVSMRRHPMYKDRLVLVGKQNIVSSYLKPTHWAPRPSIGDIGNG